MITPPASRITGYIPGLHALRAYAALSVIIWHVSHFIPGWFQVDVNTGILLQLTMTGTDAVTLFFVLSGFLLTSILLEEKHECDQVDVRRFYLRRVRRIASLYYLVLLVTAAVSIATAPDYAIVFARQFDSVQFPAALGFAAFVPLALDSISGMISHYWSLGVEVIFYALAPTLALTRRVPLALGLVIGLRLLILALTPPESAVHQIALHMKVDALAIGALFAWLWHTRRLSVEHVLTTLPARIVLALALGILILFETPVHNVAIDYGVALASGWLIVNVTAGHFVVENKITRWLGDISYGMYLWHMLALFAVGASGIAGVRSYAAVIATTLLLASLSYRVVERPFMRSRRRHPVATANIFQGRTGGE